eukprot:TRINITY_DN1842_c0_g1_i1.p1 TRINITY_DN1842_c0_g1~~TRINITY_DN1842_c0_g1_i1.p1  ORF type:complete len:463 (-),score=92.59 TRINITY_DN1842_c0_g1_i1:108-1496(-)
MINGLLHLAKDIVKDVAHGMIDSTNRIWVQVNQPSYVGGETIVGTVEMDCLVPFFANGVLLKVKGFERAFFQTSRTVTEGDGDNRRTRTIIDDHKEEKEFFKQTIVVYPQQGVVNPGHYSFPFVFNLPPNLPGTFHEEGGDRFNGSAYCAKILYKLKATVDVAFRHDLKKTVRLVLNERYDQLVRPSYAENKKSFLTTSGDLHIRVWLDKNAYVPGETCIAKLKANNTSVKPTRVVRMKVHHHLELRVHSHTKQQRKTVYTQEFPGFSPCFYGINWMPFFIPVGLKPSSNGHHVKSHYLFELECDIPAAVDLCVNLPIALLAPQFLYSTVPPQPPNAPLPPNVTYRPLWQDDQSAASCTKCRKNFSLFVRRHHCRHCSRIFCDSCTSKKCTIPKLKYHDIVRVCDACFPQAQAGGVKLASAKQVMQAYYQMLAAAQPQIAYPPQSPPPVVVPNYAPVLLPGI